jgi:two-component system, OmpR family, alkaline phosphatase synthesis response regulator PhoP
MSFGFFYLGGLCLDSTLRILIIEDSPTQAAVIAELVRQIGFTPVVYTEVRAGIHSILAREQPKVVLLDLKLLDAKGNPVADGFQICREIKRSPSKPPVIVISAQDDDEACEYALLQGADAFLQKPFVATDLTDAITTVLRG